MLSFMTMQWFGERKMRIMRQCSERQGERIADDSCGRRCERANEWNANCNNDVTMLSFMTMQLAAENTTDRQTATLGSFVQGRQTATLGSFVQGQETGTTVLVYALGRQTGPNHPPVCHLTGFHRTVSYLRILLSISSLQSLRWTLSCWTVQKSPGRLLLQAFLC